MIHVDKTFVPIVEALKEVVTSMSGESPVVVMGAIEQSELTVAIELSGGPGVQVWLSAGVDSLAGLYETAMGWVPDDPQEIEDFLGELANQTLGPAAILLPNVDPNSLTIPRIVESWGPERCWQVRGGGYRFSLGARRGSEDYDLKASQEEQVEGLLQVEKVATHL